MIRSAVPRDLLAIAHEHFGIDAFREGQEEAIHAVLSGHDTLAVLPTGHGKSAIYQVAAVVLDGPTVVVSPLIALQRDQVEGLEDLPAGGAAIVNSNVGVSAQNEAFAQLESGELEFLFLAPEQLHREEVLERLKAARPSLFVIDEAHCISEWGHDFRSDYLRLGAVIEALGHPRVLALTATAAEPVREEIIERLHMQRPRLILRGMDRPNIFLKVHACASDEARQRLLLDHVEAARFPGIVYAATHRQAEECADALNERGIKAAYYHGGLGKQARNEVQADFMAGTIPVIVATSAFGMGVDKPDVRFVFHLAASNSLDAYYQQLGRAGRDGEPAEAHLFFRPQDLNLHKFFAGGGRLDGEAFEEVAAAVQAAGEIDQETLQERVELSNGKLTRALAELENQGAVALSPTGEVRSTADDPAAAAQEAAKQEAAHHQNLLRRLERMRVYAELSDCRRQYLLEYFGEESTPCGHCDNCERGLPAPEPLSEERPYPLKTRVRHREWGKGVVMRYEGEHVTIAFDEVGEKELALGFVQEHGLLERVT